MDFRLTIHCDNYAFDGEGRGAEVARILERIAHELRSGVSFAPHYITLRDANGNDVGRAAFKEPKS